MSGVTRAVGRYELLDEIGQGGMAVVYRARQTDLRREVAIKELRAFHAPDRELAQRFVFEARLAGSLSHQNIVTVFDFFEHAGTPYIAMEYLARGSLRGYLRDLSLAQAAGVFEGLLAGLTHAEEEGIVHRDLKPENLLVSRGGQIKIADFGIARASGSLQSSGFHTATGSTVGTPAYMAPEQAMGQAVGPWTDLYAVGIIAFELFAGRVPFDGSDSLMAVMYRHISEPIPPVSSLNPSVPPGISDWIERLLVKDPAQRTSSAAAAWDELEEQVIELLGPRWRRQALLVDADTPAPRTGPATPAPEQGTSDYRTFARAEPHGRAVDGPATPPPGNLPAGPMMPSSADVPVGPPTPVPRPQADPPRLDSPPSTPAPAQPIDPPGSVRAPSAAALTVPPRATPPLDRDAEPVPRHPRRPRRRLVIAGAALVALVCAVAIAIVILEPGGEQASPRPAAPRVALTAGPLHATVPAGWRRVAAGDAAATLDVAAPAAAAPAGSRARGTVTIGLAGDRARNAALLAPALRKSLTNDPAADRVPVRDLPAGLEAYRYDRLRTRSGEALSGVYAIPTSAGVATIACAAPVTAETCASIARTLKVRGASPFPVGPSAGYAARVNRSLGDLSTRLRRRKADIAAARTARSQARAATVIARAYRASRAPLRSLKLSPADVDVNARLLAALHSTSEGYDALGRAARRLEPKNYRLAAARVRRSQTAVVSAVRRIRSGGYAALLTAGFRRHAVPKLELPPPVRVVTPPPPVPATPDPVTPPPVAPPPEFVPPPPPPPPDPFLP